MRVSAVVEDKTIVVNGVGRECELVLNDNVHAVHWDGRTAHFELSTKVGGGVLFIDPLAIIPLVAAWEAQAPTS